MGAASGEPGFHHSIDELALVDDALGVDQEVRVGMGVVGNKCYFLMMTVYSSFSSRILCGRVTLAGVQDVP